MNDPSHLVRPTMFRGGQPSEYAVEILKNQGLGTRHLPSGRVVPHVLSSGSQPLDMTLVGPNMAGSALQPLSVLRVANLGVGLPNLGVSAWTAWKVYKVDKKIDIISEGVGRMDRKLDAVGHLLIDSVSHLDQLIRGNAILLGSIIENQGHLGAGIGQLLEEVERGFKSLHDALTSAEARRNAQEFEQQMRVLLRYYELCTTAMQDGQPPISDLRKIIDVATSLIAWLETQMGTFRVGRPERLPLLVARTFALRLEVEARNQLDEAPGVRFREFEEVRGVIRNEVTSVIGGASLFALAHEHHELVKHYIYLSRALRGSATIVEFGDGTLVPYYPQNILTWDDGLDEVRRAVQCDGDPASEPIELRTLEEHRSVQALMGLPRGETEAYADRDEIFRAIGLPQGSEISEKGLRELLRVGPRAAEEAKSRIKKEVE